MNTGATMPGFHVRPTGAIAQIIHAVRAQVLNQLACSDHVRLFACQYPPIVPLTRPRHQRLKFASAHPNYDIFSPREQLTVWLRLERPVARTQRRKIGQRRRWTKPSRPAIRRQDCNLFRKGASRYIQRDYRLLLTPINPSRSMCNMIACAASSGVTSAVLMTMSASLGSS